LKHVIKNAINVFVGLCNKRAVVAGWYNDPKTGKPIERNIGELLALVHSEISEALEGYRKKLMDDHLPHRRMVEVELADAVIRIADLAGYLDLDLGGAIMEKLEYNRTRADHKLVNRAKAGGKAF
jgi:NTP pyrophosphatase (non-canonical NTP hydrolase)